jgi:hypothetical protein
MPIEIYLSLLILLFFLVDVYSYFRLLSDKNTGSHLSYWTLVLALTALPFVLKGQGTLIVWFVGFIPCGIKVKMLSDARARTTQLVAQKSFAEFLKYSALPPETELTRDPKESFKNRKMGVERIRAGAVRLGLALALFSVYKLLFDSPKMVLVSHCYNVFFTAFLAVGLGTFVEGCIMRGTGYRVPKLFDSPLRSSSLQDFWSRRWNLLFQRTAYRDIFLPLKRKGFSSIFCVFAVFLFSGLLHEYLIILLDSRFSGFQLLFFLLQAVGFVVSNRVKTGLLNTTIRARTFALIWLFGTSYFFFIDFVKIFPQIY